MVKRILAVAALVAACGGAEPATKAPAAGIRDVVVMRTGASTPLPFDARGGRLTRVTQEVTALLGHPVVLELDTALSPEIASSLEETVLASFEGLAGELAVLRTHAPGVFAEAKKLERVLCTYDAVAKESRAALADGGRVLEVRSPPDRFPLLERGVATEALVTAYEGALDDRFGDADPSRLSTTEAEAWFAYMTKTRAWLAARERAAGERSARTTDTLRIEHLARIVALGNAIDPRSALGKKVKAHLLRELELADRTPRLGRWADHADEATSAKLVKGYDEWLVRTTASFDDEDRLAVYRGLVEKRFQSCGTCVATPAFPSFDVLAFGLAVHEDWARAGATTEPPKTARGELWHQIVCPRLRGRSPSRSCGRFFEVALADPGWRAKLANAILDRRDARLLESALTTGTIRSTKPAIALLEAVGGSNPTMFRQATTWLVEDESQSGIASALEGMSGAWWREQPSRRGLVLLLQARHWESLGPHYGDSAATRFAAEHGGPASDDVLADFLAFGPRAVELAPAAWKALARTASRDARVAAALPALLERDRAEHTTRATVTLARLRKAFCEEQDAAGFAALRAELTRWAKARPDDAASVSNAIADASLAKCPPSN